MYIQCIYFATEPTNTLPRSALASSSIVSELMKVVPKPIPSTTSMVTGVNVTLNAF